MTAPLTRQMATTDLTALRVEGRQMAPEPRPQTTPPGSLTDLNARTQAAGQRILFLDVPRRLPPTPPPAKQNS